MLQKDWVAPQVNSNPKEEFWLYGKMRLLRVILVPLSLGHSCVEKKKVVFSAFAVDIQFYRS